ncbi:hypothetical protein OG978_33705 [Streptomyces sp. NBC_01591]|uniref:hypothetical protein n=1 Tax=Streptomyces sp. NBC_01591 TaxID=2975888 RepID=UPI002DDC7907|nr:hypothetical protein [Streptomyces sp. NBC_01591]WSD71918.1 hypothetical protein OG978_33705 [Streptomyces sp. NBC_01591]
MTTTTPVTAENILARYAADIAFVAEEQPATTIEDFIDQLQTVAERLDSAGIQGAEDLETAATYLTDAAGNTDDTKRTALLGRATKLLAYADDVVGEYRLMV